MVATGHVSECAGLRLELLAKKLLAGIWSILGDNGSMFGLDVLVSFIPMAGRIQKPVVRPDVELIIEAALCASTGEKKKARVSLPRHLEIVAEWKKDGKPILFSERLKDYVEYVPVKMFRLETRMMEYEPSQYSTKGKPIRLNTREKGELEMLKVALGIERLELKKLQRVQRLTSPVGDLPAERPIPLDILHLNKGIVFRRTEVPANQTKVKVEQVSLSYPVFSRDRRFASLDVIGKNPYRYPGERVFLEKVGSGWQLLASQRFSGPPTW